MAKVNVFVYGSLKKGHRNHRVLHPGAKYIRNAKIDGFNLFKICSWPGIKHGGGKVYGEIYEVEKDHLLRLDSFEGCPTLFNRFSVKARLLESKKVVDAFVYVYTGKVDSTKKLKAGIFRLCKSRIGKNLTI